MNHQPFYHCVDFAEPIPETKADKAKIELLAKKSVPRGQHDTVEFCGGQLMFTAYRDVTTEVEKRLRKAGFDVLDGNEAEPGDPSDLM